ncbi:hypothetical protein [Methylomonas sp. DH-1]|uniref:hypothetical protein n=1 Tax=Methylomonas sp. (strain DH-1) TaxID=1727196 RepID=UPI0007C943A6|nr:hypothetical protein [Methylomonas sp. DH-1]ANE54428.1 hypothetical protein AYM39_03980 [Methylomonas sp. DH-1]
MAIQSDARGFLIGDPIELGRKSSDISHISEDVSAIRRTISERWHGYTRPSPSASPARDASGKFTSASTVKVAVPNSSKSSGGTTAAAGNAVVAERIRRVSSGGGAELPGRDSAGRFTAGGSSASNKSASVIASIGDRLSRLTAVTSGIDDADPAVKAAREVAEPLRRGFEFFQGDKQTSWLKKIFSKLSIFQKEESVYNKVSTKTLKNIEGKTGIQGEDGSFSGGATGSILGRAIPWALGGLAAAGSGLVSMIGGALTATIAAVFSPIGVAVAAAGVAAWGIFTDDGRKFFADLGGKMAEGWSKFTDFLVESSPKTMEFLKKAGDKAGAAIDSVKGAAGKATSFVTEQAKDVGNYLVKSSPKTMAAIEKVKGFGADAISKAANAFQGDTPSGLTTAQFAALAADTRRTESSGKTTAENKYGYLGSYQFGAAALADAGLIDPAKLKAARKDGRFDQKTFLANPANWLLSGGKDAFLADQALQDQTYSKYAGQLQKAGLRSGALSAGSTPEQIAAYIKAAHLVGAGGANDYFTRGRDRADANGTLASLYAKQGALAVASVSAPPVGLMPKALTIPQIAEAPKVIEPLGSPEAKAFTVNIPSQDVGQSLSDRRIAHIASGGIGG